MKHKNTLSGHGVDSANAPGQARIHPSPEAGCSAWQPMDTAPRDGRPIIILVEWPSGAKRVMGAIRNFRGSELEWDVLDDRRMGIYAVSQVDERIVKAWQPMPELPNASREA